MNSWMFCRLFSKYFCCRLFAWNKPSLAAPLYGFILLFTIVGCNSSPKDFTIDYEDSAKIAAPTYFSGTGGYGKVILKWIPVAGATGYIINYGTSSNDLNRTKTIGDGDGDATTIKVEGIDLDGIAVTVGELAGGIKHYFVVRATNGIAVLMEPSSVADTFPKFIAPEDLSADTNPKVTGEVTLTWKKLDNATNYIIYYGTAKDALDKTQDVAGNLTTTEVAGLIANTKYFFAISAYNSNAQGIKSTEEVSATPTGPMLDMPNITAITAKSKTQVDLTWDKVTSNTFTVTGYTVKYSTAGVDKTIDIPNPNTLKVSVTGLAAGTTYSFSVRADATDDGGSVVGGYSTAESVTTWFNAVSGFSAKANTTTAGAVDLSWDKVANAPGYAIRYGITSDANDGTHDVSGDSTTYTIINLTQGTAYNFKIIVAGSINSKAVKGEYSAATATPTAAQAQAGASSIISLTAKSKTQVDLTWDEVTSDTFTVTGLGAKSSSSTAGAIDLTWDAVARAAGYIISYGTSSNGDGNTRDVASRTTDTISGLTQGTPYYFKIAVKGQVSGQDVTSDYTSVVSAGAPYSALVNVGLYATWDAVNDKHAIDVTWDSSTIATGYEIYYAETPFDGVADLDLESHATANGGAKIAGADINIGTPIQHELSHRISNLSADKNYDVLVIGTTNNANTVRHPGKSAKTLGIVDLAQGRDHLCALLNTGVVKCWGNNSHRKAMASDSNPVLKPTTYDVTDDTSQKVTAITAGYQHNCAIVEEDSSVYCWGKNADGELGVGSTSSSTKPNKVQADDAGTAFKAKVVQAGVSVTCAVGPANKSYCWGDGTNHGLGVSSTVDQSRPQVVADLTSEVTQFALGHQAGCALDVSDNLWCWGDGIGSPFGAGNVAKKVDLSGDATVDSISSTHEFSCGVTKKAELQCWGINTDGQLGKDSTSKDTKQDPDYVLSTTAGDRLGKVAGVAVGVNHACAWFTDDTAPRCWGGGKEGQLGVKGSTADISYAANPVSGLENSSLITKITAGENTSCALLTDKTTIRCWGDNSNGQFGNGLTTGSALSTVDLDALFSK